MGSSFHEGVMITCGSATSESAKSSAEIGSPAAGLPSQIELKLHRAVAVGHEVREPAVVENHGQDAVGFCGASFLRASTCWPPKVTSGASRLTHSQFPCGVS